MFIDCREGCYTALYLIGSFLRPIRSFVTFLYHVADVYIWDQTCAWVTEGFRTEVVWKLVVSVLLSRVAIQRCT